jgi:hypothetical protein
LDPVAQLLLNKVIDRRDHPPDSFSFAGQDIARRRMSATGG